MSESDSVILLSRRNALALLDHAEDYECGVGLRTLS